MSEEPKQNSRVLAREWQFPRHSEYEKDLRAAAGRWFSQKGCASAPGRPYCLDQWENWSKNIIHPEVVEYILADRSLRRGSRGFPLHKYVHHGLSSQALLFNLLGPLVVRNDFEPLQRALAAKGIEWPDDGAVAEFEYEDRNIFREDSGQPTSIDLIVKDRKGNPRIFIEGKLVEKEFGSCSVFVGGDCEGRNPAANLADCYLHHIGRRYWDLMKEHGFLDGPLRTEKTCIFASHYQFFREVLFAIESAGTFVLLSDERSPTFFCTSKDGSRQRGLMPFLIDLVPEKLRHRIASITIQELLAEVEETGRHSWSGEFRLKYGMS